MPKNKVEISVRGSHTVALPPQRGTVYTTVACDGPDPDVVFGTVAGSLAALRASVESLHDPDAGPVTWFAIDQVRVESHRPWNAEGVQLPLVHRASVSVAVRFRDFDALGRWVSANAGLPGLSVGAIDWTLTRRTRARAERKTRQKALRNARQRAQDYADALGLGAVRVRSVGDPGIGGPAQRKVVMASATASAGGAPDLGLRPEDVEIEAYVEATFHLAGR